jgi:uncharacterized protein HemX
MAVVVVAVLLGVGALVWCYGLQNHLAATEQKLADADKKNADLAEQARRHQRPLSATTETLSQNVGATQKQIDARAQTIMAAQKAQTPRPPSSRSSSRPPRSRSARSRPTWPA